MAHKDSGNYAGKHPQGAKPDRETAEALESVSRDGKISCAAAFTVVRDLGLKPGDVGMTIDLLEYRITKCQLGLFGYGPERGILSTAEDVSPKMKQAIDKNLLDGRISCAACWEIADLLRCARRDVASACEALSIKINACQLGSF
ncbi:MAG: hypothetical protein PHU03_02490 [Syntrophales bacterium]|nr:hypothetical protein [Syntrophales bacterium]